MAKTNSVVCKSGLIGYLQGSIKGIITSLKYKDELTLEEQFIKRALEEVLVESEELWNKVKGSTH